MSDPSRPTRTLWLCGILHGFTHVYHVALLPLYFQIQRDFKLASVGQATFLVTSMMAAYFLPSYFMGHLADRMSRKKLLEWGLYLNSAGFVGLALAPNYSCALAAIVLAGFGGSFFHPAATAMVVRTFPASPGRALGLIGMGASVGFFLGPVYSGWRAASAGWRAPVMELGIAGIVAAVLFGRLAIEEVTRANVTERVPEKVFPTRALWFLFLCACLCFSLRDFVGNSMGTLGSLFLQKAHGLELGATGFTLSGIFIASLFSNPLFGRLSDSGRKRWAAFVVTVAAIVVYAFPHLPRRFLAPALMIYGFFFMANYPIIEAALMESVPDAVRGRVFGLFITVGGFLGNFAHWVMGRWVESLGSAAKLVSNYRPMYALLAIFAIVSLLGLPCLQRIRKREGLIMPAYERSPA
ncbi:MAG TPA: MFS transporter [Verrucomicrobiae bacterium]|nr:MFS transporter [Verrucomicrobiae bacterium]